MLQIAVSLANSPLCPSYDPCATPLVLSTLRKHCLKACGVAWRSALSKAVPQHTVSSPSASDAWSFILRENGAVPQKKKRVTIDREEIHDKENASPEEKERRSLRMQGRPPLDIFVKTD
jgi:hypothetical protein